MRWEGCDVANMDELTIRVLHGLERCGMEPDFIEDCGDCPYRHKDDDFCITKLCRDARTVILHQDMLLGQM